MLIFLAIILLFTIVVWGYMQQARFGRAPSGLHLERLMKSPNFKERTFHNLSNTPSLTGGASYYTVMRDFFFRKSERSVPSAALPSKKVELKGLKPADDVIIWFGHSSYFMQLDGKRILVDPVFSGTASPLSFTTKAFAGTDAYGVDDMPRIDFLFITHDHYDHLDHQTMVGLRKKVAKVITGLGVGAHLERWGYDKAIIAERDWNDWVDFGGGYSAHILPARHFSGRGFKRNGTLWVSFMMTTPTKKIYIGGDSGYDTHFAKIGQQYGPFDLAILENGQYNKYWKYIHMMPEEVVQAAIDLKARRLMPVHWSKFALSLHDWDEPIKRVVAEAKKRNMPLLHPIIGEMVKLNELQEPAAWWEGVK